MRFGTRELLFVLVLLAMPVAGWWFVYKPANQQLAQARAEVLAKQAKLAQLATATRQMQDLGEEIDKLTKAVQVFEAKLPEEREVEVILKQVWQLAVKHGLKPRSVRADKTTKSARYTELPLKMVIAGDFDGFYSFLLDLERLSRITRIPQMQLVRMNIERLRQQARAAKEPENFRDGAMEATFTLSIFFESDDHKPQGT